MPEQTRHLMNRNIATVVILSFALLCVGCDNKVESAKKLWQENSQDQALSKLKDELTNNPSNADAAKLLEVYQTKIDQQNLEKIAADEIRKQMHYPKNVFDTYDFIQGSPFEQEAVRLIREGFLVLVQQGPEQHPYFRGTEMYWITNIKPTEKGKKIIESAGWDAYGKKYAISILTYTEDISKIDEILVDSKHGEALVKFEVGFTPTDYFNSLKKIGTLTYSGLHSPDMPAPSEHVAKKNEISFKKWDNGWRIK